MAFYFLFCQDFGILFCKKTSWLFSLKMLSSEPQKEFKKRKPIIVDKQN
ncbi:hypothetical protein Ple7327_1256 [Pleurocapsa sp. PCC 7327]|nr:hypothetical protein Ple7327_1256 [Pleurocapsa sp. PCC 7327]